MGLSTPAKIGLVAAGLLVLNTAVKAQVSKLKDAPTNFLFNVFFKRIHGLKNGVLTLVYGAEIKNLSGFSVPIKNAFILLQFSSDNGMNWENIGASNERISINLPDNKTTPVEIGVQVNVGDTLKTLLAKSNRYRIVIKYDVFGATQQYVKAYDFTKQLKSIPGFKGIDGVKAAKTDAERARAVKSIIINIRHIYAFPFSSPGQGQRKARPAKKSQGENMIPPMLTEALDMSRLKPVNPFGPPIAPVKQAIPAILPVKQGLKTSVPVKVVTAPSPAKIILPVKTPQKTAIPVKLSPPKKPIPPKNFLQPAKPMGPVKPVQKISVKPLVLPSVPTGIKNKLKAPLKGAENLI